MMNIFERITETSNEPAVEEYALQALKRRMGRNDLILEICSVKKWDWEKSENLVKKVESGNAADISILWSRIFLVAGVIFFAAGVITLLFLFDDTIGLNYFFQCLGHEISNLTQSTPADNTSMSCLAITAIGLGDIFFSQTGIFLVMLIAGGISGAILAQNQYKKLVQNSGGDDDK
jgi:hypothetical protein